MNRTFIVRGQRVRTSSQRRFVVFVGRDKGVRIQKFDSDTQTWEFVEVDEITPYIVARSDNATTARRRAEKLTPRGGYHAIIDTSTGKEI